MGSDFLCPVLGLGSGGRFLGHPMVLQFGTESTFLEPHKSPQGVGVCRGERIRKGRVGVGAEGECGKGFGPRKLRRTKKHTHTHTHQKQKTKKQAASSGDPFCGTPN